MKINMDVQVEKHISNDPWTVCSIRLELRAFITTTTTQVLPYIPSSDPVNRSIGPSHRTSTRRRAPDQEVKSGIILRIVSLCPSLSQRWGKSEVAGQGRRPTFDALVLFSLAMI
mmetsp:Transcript_2873/g.3233  ORF Transcript_2873/g.3233 Transcript_2873/m.3233 type:complete len:114 (+) Transcript_2873:80-421(+)